jgi:hypothetical protein
MAVTNAARRADCSGLIQQPLLVLDERLVVVVDGRPDDLVGDANERP